jgi:hypothetical protein
MEVWDLEIFILSIWPCSGGFSKTHPSLCAQVLSEGIIQAVQYWRPRQKMVFRIHGDVYLKELLRKGLYGGLALEATSTSLLTPGSQEEVLEDSSLKKAEML